ncbi:MAG: Ig-like domain-containing protein, partial [Gammaproteobacteria bacterium]|nr:Ig-like domain-containing protein [Gammaproteobacteria bacterium]
MLYKKMNGLISAKSIAVCLLALTSLPNNASAATHTFSSGNFTMLTPTGALTGGATDVNGSFDDSKICDSVACTDVDGITLASTQPFLGPTWTAHHARVFGPGTYTVDTDCDGTQIAAGTTSCPANGTTDTIEGPDLTFTVNPGQLGAHMLFDWSTSTNIDVAVVWNYNTDFNSSFNTAGGSITPVIYNGGCPAGIYCDATMTLVRAWNITSTDGNGNNIPGIPMVDGPFPNFHANFNLDMTVAYNPVDVTDDTADTVNGVAVIDVLANDSDAVDGTPPDPAAVTVNITSDGAQASVASTVNPATGAITYTANTAFSGVDTIKYTVTDSDTNISAKGSVTITVTQTPVASNVTFSTNTDVQKVIAITDLGAGSTAIATDGDTATASLTFVNLGATAQAGNGSTVTGNGLSSLTYTPPTGLNGLSDTFTFQVTDGVNTSAAMTMTIDVNNVLPVAATDSAGVLPSNAVIITVLDNDSDAEDGPTPGSLSEPTVTLAINTQGTKGTAVANGDGTITYTAGTITVDPTPDSFTYDLTDSDGGTSTGTVNVTISNTVNNAPIGYDSAFTTDAGTALQINIDTSTGGGPGGIIADDNDTIVQPLTFTAVSATSAQGGTVSVDGTGKIITYTPAAGYNALDAATDSFTFKVSDGIGTSAVANTMTITVNALPPVANDDLGNTMLLTDGTLSIDVLANDTDVEDDATATALTITTGSLAGADAGDAVINAGKIDFTPTTVGAKSFTYTVTDSDGFISGTAQVDITVTAAPTTSNKTLSTNEDTALVITLPDATIADDLDGDTLAFDVVDASSTQGGTIVVSTTTTANDTLTYTPAANYNGLGDTFTFSV